MLIFAKSDTRKDELEINSNGYIKVFEYKVEGIGGSDISLTISFGISLT